MRMVGSFMLIGVAVVATVMVVAPRVADPVIATAWVAAAGICAGAGIIALIPAALVAPRFPPYLLEAGLAAILLRLFLTLAVGALYLRWYAPPKWAFLNAMLVFYLLSLATDTAVTYRLAKRYWMRSG